MGFHDSDVILGFIRRLRFAVGLGLVLTGAMTCSSGFAVDRTFNISYVAEASNPYVNGLPTACSPAVSTSCVYGDIWAENGYVYVGTDVNNGGVNVFSVANPASPQFMRHVTNLDTNFPITKPTYVGDQFEDVEVWDGIGYFGSDTNSSGTGVDIVDLSVPFDPVLLNRYNGSDCNAVGCGHSKVHTISVAKTADDRSFLYTTDNQYTDQVRITDVTSCVKTAVCNPQLVASVDMGLNSNIFSHEVIVRNDRMYVASKSNTTATDGWVNIYNVADPANPVFLKKWNSGVRTHTALPSADGKLLVVAEEHPDNVNGYGSTNVKIYDISMINSPNDPDTPILLSTINRASAGIDATSPHHPHLHGNLLFLPWYEAGLQVFNITNPSNPVHVGSFDTYPGTTPTSYAGDWGVDLSMGLNRVFLSDRNRGLIVVDASGVLAQGDYDQNMVVNQLDYDAWRSTYGSGTSGLHANAFADGNNNNNVDTADFVMWRKNVGKTGPVGQGAGHDEFVITTVPEPATVILLAVGSSLILMCRRVCAD